MFGDMTILVVLAVLFFVVANPMTYKVVDQLLSAVGMTGMIFEAGSVSQIGTALHTVVFVALFCLYQKFVAPMMAGGGYVQDEEEVEEGEVEGFMEHEGEEDVEGHGLTEIIDEQIDERNAQEDEFLQDEDFPEKEPNPNFPGAEAGEPVLSSGVSGAAADSSMDSMDAFEGFQSGGMGAAY